MHPSEAVRDAGAAMGEAIAIFMLHPQTMASSVSAGYFDPTAGYVAGRGGVLGAASPTTVASVFAVFEPAMIQAAWEEGVAVRGAAGAAKIYWEQLAFFAEECLADAEGPADAAGLARLAELGERVVAATFAGSLPLYAGWREMPLAAEPAARAAQVMFVLRELRAGVHLNALSLSGVTPVEAHMLGHDAGYTRMFGWPEPFADGADKRDRYEGVQQTTNRRMTEIFQAALSDEEIEELAVLAVAALAWLKAA